MSDKPLGRFCWYELLTTDPEEAPRFYGEIAGWGTDTWENGDRPYTMWMNGERSIGGVMELPEDAVEGGAPPHWLAHVSTPDLESTVSRARELGATVLKELEVPTVGSFAIIRDPQGAVFSAYEPDGDAPGHDDMPGVGEFSWNELATTDAEAAWSFYSELFAWKKDQAMDMGPDGTYQLFGRGAHPVGAMFRKPPQMPAPAWLFYVRVPDVEAAVASVGKLGGRVLNGPMDVPGGKIAQCSDPQGAVFAVHEVSG